MTWDRAQIVLVALAFMAGGIGLTLLGQVLSPPPTVTVKQVRTVSIAPTPVAIKAPAEPARKAKRKPEPK